MKRGAVYAVERQASRGKQYMFCMTNEVYEHLHKRGHERFGVTVDESGSVAIVPTKFGRKAYKYSQRMSLTSAEVFRELRRIYNVESINLDFDVRLLDKPFCVLCKPWESPDPWGGNE